MGYSSTASDALASKIGITMISTYYHHSNSSLVTMATNKTSNGRTMNSTTAVEPPKREGGMKVGRDEGRDGYREGGGKEDRKSVV